MSERNYVAAIDENTETYLTWGLRELLMFVSTQGTFYHAYSSEFQWVSYDDLVETVDILKKCDGDYQVLKESLTELAQDEIDAAIFFEEEQENLKSILAESDEVIKELEKLISLSRMSYIMYSY